MQLVILISLVLSASAWDSEQLEVFDVVDEVKENFYEMLNITKDAESARVRSAFRRLSVQWHPDKNPNEDTSEKFRNLVSVYEVLKDPKKRSYYDEVLVNGLPNWKSAMFYYRRVRKMGILEGGVIILFLATVIQYICLWASYFENKYTMEQLKKPKKGRKFKEEVEEEILKPSILNTLPFQIPYFIFFLILSIPKGMLSLKDAVQEKLEEMKEQEVIEEVPVEPKPRKKRPVFEIPEGPNFEIQKQPKEKRNNNKSPVQAPPVSGGFWTDDDLTELIQLVKKYPGGTPKRWDVIAEHMSRSVPEVTYMANRMKNNGYRVPGVSDEPEEEKVEKTKTKGGKLSGVEESLWSQIQQKALEDALSKFTKGATDRWDRIAELVPEKSKEDCILRYKHLVESIKKQKQQ